MIYDLPQRFVGVREVALDNKLSKIDVIAVRPGKPRRHWNWQLLNGWLGSTTTGLLSSIGYVPPAEAEVNYYRQLAGKNETEVST